MRDVARARGTAGLTVASTFSGCGGSCLGFEMAGYRVVWANEFLPIACASYAANHPDTVLDGRDITKVTAGEILAAAKLRKGELDVFNGSPPCQAFSSAGQGASGWGTQREYSNGVKQKNEDLFFEYTRLLAGLQPRAFVAENVVGLTRGQAIGMFKDIMRALSACGYNVQCKVLDAQWLGVPQSRGRAIFIGVRKDLGEQPAFPAPLRYRYSVREALPHIERVIHDTRTPSFSAGDVTNRPSPAITIGVNSICSLHFKVTDRSMKSGHRRFTIEELRVICGFPADFILKGTYAEQWARLGNAVPPLMMHAVAAKLRDGLFTRLSRRKERFRDAVS